MLMMAPFDGLQMVPLALLLPHDQYQRDEALVVMGQAVTNTNITFTWPPVRLPRGAHGAAKWLKLEAQLGLEPWSFSRIADGSRERPPTTTSPLATAVFDF